MNERILVVMLSMILISLHLYCQRITSLYFFYNAVCEGAIFFIVKEKENLLEANFKAAFVCRLVW